MPDKSGGLPVRVRGYAAYRPHATNSTRWPVVLPGADFSALIGMPDENATVLEFAAILGEAIARAHLAGRQVETTRANATVDVGRGVRVNVPIADGDWNDEYDSTYCRR